jgi:hypothetical protein
LYYQGDYMMLLDNGDFCKDLMDMHSQCKTILHIPLIKIHQFATSPHSCMVILKLLVWHGW